MTYNGIGLRTPRGSGTNGYIQRNLAHISRPREEFIVGLKTQRHKRVVSKPDKLRVDPSIMEHNRKREIEVVVFALQCKLEDEGKTEEEIEFLTSEYRQKLLNQIQSGRNPISKDKRMDDSHQRTQQKLDKNAMMRTALGLRENEEGDVEDEWEEKRKEKRRKMEEEQTEEDRIRYEMERISKHPLDHSWPSRKRKNGDRGDAEKDMDRRNHKSRNHSDRRKHKDRRSSKKRKRREREESLSDSDSSSSDSSSQSSLSDDSSDDSSDCEVEERKKRKRKRRRSGKRDESVHRNRHRQIRKEDVRDRKKRRKRSPSRSRSRSRSNSRRPSRSRSRSDAFPKSNVEDRGRWGDADEPSRQISKSTKRIVPDFE